MPTVAAIANPPRIRVTNIETTPDGDLIGTVSRVEGREPARNQWRRACLEAITKRAEFWSLRDRARYIPWDGRMTAWGV